MAIPKWWNYSTLRVLQSVENCLFIEANQLICTQVAGDGAFRVRSERNARDLTESGLLLNASRICQYCLRSKNQSLESKVIQWFKDQEIF